MTLQLSAIINDTSVISDVDPRTSLGDFLRDDCGLSGTHLGCEHGVCGSCTVIVDDMPVRSCILYAVQAHGRSIRTIEGFKDDEIMRRLREAFSLHHALQCGFCTAGMLITGRDIIKRLGPIDEDRIREELSGNLCRCTGYVGIVKAIQDVAAQLGTRALSFPELDAKPRLDFSEIIVAPATPGAQKEALKPVSSRPESSKLGPGAYSVSREVSIAHAIDFVWKEFEDPNAIAACLPGAELTGKDGDQISGRVKIKIGPIRAQFVGDASYIRDEKTKSGRVTGGGRDSLSNSRVNGELRFRMSPSSDTSTVMNLHLAFTVQGMLAQFSRPAIINDFTSFMIEQFSENLTQRLSDPGGARNASSAGLTFSRMLRWQVKRLWNRLLRRSGSA